jgi:hypothetical protein
MNLQEQIDFIKALSELAGKEAKPKFEAVIDSLWRLQGLEK